MASDVVAYLAISLDGFIASSDGSVSFLDDFASDELGFHNFIAGIGAAVMDRQRTSRSLASAGRMVKHRRLFSRHGRWMRPTGRISHSHRNARDTLSRASVREPTSASGSWAVARLSPRLSSDGALDTLELYVIPVVLGSGVPLFTEPWERPLKLLEVQTYANGVVKLLYSTSIKQTD
ncbi:MAG: dihydrofolate reductase family protein [Acidimicrobiia bacterium]|nr:MAG: dihydrofolate reductase family protein [Acidimicrobiia bacterium]